MHVLHSVVVAWLNRSNTTEAVRQRTILLVCRHIRVSAQCHTQYCTSSELTSGRCQPTMRWAEPAHSEHASSVGHHARSVQRGLPVCEHEITVLHVAVHYLADTRRRCTARFACPASPAWYVACTPNPDAVNIVKMPSCTCHSVQAAILHALCMCTRTQATQASCKVNSSNQLSC